MSDQSGWKRLFRLDESSRHIDRNIDEEIQFHIDSRIEHLMEAGMSEEEARASAYREFQGIEDTKLHLRKIGGWRLRRRIIGELLSTLGWDIRIAIRSYLKRPGFALTVIMITALGIGATTTIFSVVDGVLIRRLPYPDPGKLVYFDNAAHPVPHYRDWEARSTAFSSIAAAMEEELDFTGSVTPEKLSGVMATRELLPMLDARPAIGRLFIPADFSEIPQVAVLSYGIWQRVFGGDESIIGKSITLSEIPVMVVGVLESDFKSPGGLTGQETDVWLPFDITMPSMQRPNYYILEVLARLRPGMTFATAQAELDQLALTLSEENPDLYRGDDGAPISMSIIPLQSAFTGRVEGPLLLLLGAVALLLAIACANIANLFLARGTDQVHEVGISYALGASRRRLTSQLLTESAVLALAGGILGVIIAYFGVRAFEIINPGRIPMVERIGVDARVLGFALCLSILTGILFGLIPAWRASRLNVSVALQDAPRGSIGGRRKSRLRNILVVAEISLALILLAGAGLLFNSFRRLQAVDPGFDIDGLAVLPLEMDTNSYDEARRRMISEQVLERMGSLPGVQQAEACYTSPFLYYGGIRAGSFESNFRNDEGEEIEDFTCINPVTDGYFTLLRANLRGREFSPGDENRDPVPVIISDHLAELLYPRRESIGRSFFTGDTGFMIIGVVSGLHHWGLDQGTTGHIFVPWKRSGAGSSRLTLVVRTEGDPAAMLPTLREIVWEIEPDLPIPEVFTMSQQIARSLAAPRFYSALFLAFAIVAILLAASGIYGSMLYSVGQRRQEMGIRTALGADRGRLIRMVVGQGALLALIGIGIGLAGALVSTRALERMVFGISTTDIPTFLIVVALLGIVAVTASFIPAWRAVEADPVVALRQE